MSSIQPLGSRIPRALPEPDPGFSPHFLPVTTVKQLFLHKYMNRYSSTHRILGLVALVGCAWSATAQTLTHRYSFNDTAGSVTFADSVGSANGSLNNDTAVNPNSASLDGTKLQLDGTGGYATLPTGIVSGYTQLTVEFWADVNASVPLWSRIFSFGDQNGVNKNTGIDYCPYAGGDYQNVDYVATGGAYANSTPGIEGLTNTHVTVVVDPVNNQMYYYNGSKVVSTQNGSISAFSAVNDTFNLLGRSLYDIDPTLNGAINEFRVYQGVVARSTVALNDASGPGVILSNPGSIVALHFSAPVNPLLVNQSSQQNLTGDFSSVSNLDVIAYGGATFTSLNTGVATINTNGVVKGVGPGTVSVVATYGSVSATNTLTVVSVPPKLVHRYSFGSDASDSVGGANGTLMGSASVAGGQLVLDGSFGSYVDLPGSAINIATNNSVTFEAWATFGNAATWAYLFGFGNTNNGGGVGQLATVPCAENGGFRHWGITENFGGGGGPRTLAWSHGWNNLSAHITCVVDPPTSTISIYRDGVLEVAQYDASAPISNVPTNYGFIGRSFYDADPYLPASIDEFRMYSGSLSPAQVALTHLNGPNVTNLDVGALSSLVVVATNYPAYASLVPPVILANYANVPNFNLLPTVTAGGNAAFNGAQPLVVTSSDTNIVSVNAQNMLTTRRPGSVTLTARFGGKTNSATVQVKNRAVLTHRYSFNTDGDTSDSVGGANGTLTGAATVSGGALQLTGDNNDYLNLPPGMLTNYNAVTVDTWANLGAPNHWARIWEFADIGTANQNEFFFAPGWNPPPDAHLYNAGFPWGAGTLRSAALGNALYHITCTYGDGNLEVYTNGVLEDIVANVVAPASSAGTISTTIGHSPYADPGINGAVDEFRIYNGRLAPDEILATDLLGPNQTLSTTVSIKAAASGGNVVLSWPLANAGFSVQASSSLAPSNWTTLTNAPALVGNTNWQVTVPASGGPRFFRLWR